MVRMGYLNVVPVGLNSAANHTGFPFRKLLPQIVLTPVEKHQVQKTGLVAAAVLCMADHGAGTVRAYRR